MCSAACLCSLALRTGAEDRTADAAPTSLAVSGSNVPCRRPRAARRSRREQERSGRPPGRPLRYVLVAPPASLAGWEIAQIVVMSA